MDCVIRLPVSVQIQFSQIDAARDGLLIDPGSHFRSVPREFAGQSNVQ
jgi:hypothetical protein